LFAECSDFAHPHWYFEVSLQQMRKRRNLIKFVQTAAADQLVVLSLNKNGEVAQ